MNLPFWPLAGCEWLPSTLAKSEAVMRLKLQRIYAAKTHTIGILWNVTKPAAPEFLCFTLEDGHRSPKVPGETRIPARTYRLALRKEGGKHTDYQKQWPTLHRGMLWLLDVLDFEFILVHIGNWPKDTRGCILVGDTCDRDGFTGKSAQAYQRVYPPIAAALEAGEEVFLQIVDET